MTFTVHALFAASVPFEKESEVAPAVGANVGEPQFEVDAFGGLATVIAPGVVGSTSLKFIPVIIPVVGLEIVNVRVDIPPAFVGSGLKFFAMVIRDGSTIFAIRVEVPKSAL